jgi:hypothetical protein
VPGSICGSLNFRSGSFSTELGCPRHVRFTPDSDHRGTISLADLKRTGPPCQAHSRTPALELAASARRARRPSAGFYPPKPTQPGAAAGWYGEPWVAISQVHSDPDENSRVSSLLSEWVLLRDLNSQVFPESDFKNTGVLLAARPLRCLALDLVRPSALDARPLLSLSHHARKCPRQDMGPTRDWLYHVSNCFQHANQNAVVSRQRSRCCLPSSHLMFHRHQSGVVCGKPIRCKATWPEQTQDQSPGKREPWRYLDGQFDARPPGQSGLIWHSIRILTPGKSGQHRKTRCPGCERRHQPKTPPTAPRCSNKQWYHSKCCNGRSDQQGRLQRR